MTPRAWIGNVVSFIAIAVIAASAVAGDNASLPAGGIAPPSVTWTVDEVADIAVRNHPLVRQSESETAAASARKGQAASFRYPSVTLAAGTSRTRAVSGTTGQSATVSNEFLRGDLSMLLTDFGRTSASVNRSDALLSATREAGACGRWSPRGCCSPTPAPRAKPGCSCCPPPSPG